MDLEALDRRIRRLEDLEEIKQLKARYAAHCDAGYDDDGLADLFTTDAVWDGGMLGRNEGREAIRQFFRGSSQRISFAVHNILSPIIEIAGDTATGTWYLLQTCTYVKGNQAVWGAATYHDRYVRESGGWKFQHVRVESHFWTSFEEGWARMRFMQRRDATN
jgi:ketosteroid isomerase-like protein